MKECIFTVPGVPIGKGRPRVTSHGTYTPQKTRDYEQKVRLCWKTQCPGMAFGKEPLMVSICAYFPVPKSASKRRREAMEGTYHISRPDCDNIAKAILDSLNGLAFPDDSTVQFSHVRKIYTNGAPRVEVTISEAGHGEE